MSEAFHGVWELDPASLDYQHGRPGLRAIYTIEPLPGGLKFTLDAEDADGKPMHHVYGGKLNGIPVRIASTEFLIRLQLLEESVIESALLHGEKVLDRWTRRVAADGQSLIITQHGTREDGSTFENVGIYRKK